MKPQAIPTPYQDLTCIVMVKKNPNYGGKVEYVWHWQACSYVVEISYGQPIHVGVFE